MDEGILTAITGAHKLATVNALLLSAKNTSIKKQQRLPYTSQTSPQRSNITISDGKIAAKDFQVQPTVKYIDLHYNRF